MKKTSIYIMSIIVIGLLILSIIVPARHLVGLTMDALSSGQSYPTESISVENDGSGDLSAAGNSTSPLAYETPIQVQFQPSHSTMLSSPDSLKFTNGETLPLILNSGIIMVNDNRHAMPSWINWAFIILSPVQMILIFFILWKLIRFIINVSKERIFVIQNVKYLRQTSTALLLIAVFQICEGYCQEKMLSLQDLHHQGYAMYASWDFPWTCIIIGAIGFLFAQVWAYGLEIKQDQELTI